MTNAGPSQTLARIALDGPSALAFYRDRCDLATQMHNHEEDTPKQANMVGEREWISDEDVAAALAETSVFGKRAATLQDEREEADPGLPVLTRTRMINFARCTGQSKQIKLIPFDHLGIRRPEPESPLYILVGSRNRQRRVVNVHERICASPVPSNSIRFAGDGVYTPSPELTFLLLARYLSLPELLLVGMELCGLYRLANANTSQPLRSNRTLYNQGALTTPFRIATCIGHVDDFPNVKLARRACAYLAASSASPMESVLYLLLCLPRHLGGYGLPRPILNAKQKVGGQAEHLTLSRNLIPDLFWSDCRLDVEYDSEEFHADPESLAAGARRTLALRAMHVEVISVTKDIVYDEEAFDAVARLVAKSTGVRMTKPTTNTLAARKHLRDAILP
ncbi:MAG: hypothetical protein IKG22_14990 [Atopobiaceae bacterium]|nr:hypothetical protein [Atopobiaceae bacterium]